MKIKTKSLTVKQLRQEYNAIVKIKHFRVYKTPTVKVIANIPRGNKISEVLKPVYPELQAKGGRWDITVELPDGKTYETTVKCSKKDHYNRKRALIIGLARLAKVLPV